MTTQNHNTKNTSTNKGDSKEKMDSKQPQHGKQGFASMPSEQVREIASKGGKASHKNS